MTGNPAFVHEAKRLVVDQRISLPEAVKTRGLLMVCLVKISAPGVALLRGY